MLLKSFYFEGQLSLFAAVFIINSWTSRIIIMLDFFSYI